MAREHYIQKCLIISAEHHIGFAYRLPPRHADELDLQAELSNRGILTPRALAMLMASPHRPVKCIHAMSTVSETQKGSSRFFMFC